MAAFEEIFLALPDGYRAYARWWQPQRPRGAVLYLHGIQSHAGWYEDSARRLCEEGFAVLQPDRRGSGRNERDRGHAGSHDQLIGDALAARDELLARSGAAHSHLVGVSWGGKLVVAAYVQDARATASLTLVTPGLFPIISVGAGEKFRIGVAMVADPTRRFDIPLNDGELFTTYPPRKAFIDTDPLTLRQATAGFYLASRRMDRVCARLRECAPVPIHLMLAEDERIIDNARTARFLRELGWPFTRITTYRAARHSLEFERDPRPYLDDLANFLNERETAHGDAGRADGAARAAIARTPRA